MKPKYPNITISLTGREGNAFYILGKVRTALIQAGASEEEREAFTNRQHQATTTTF